MLREEMPVLGCDIVQNNNSKVPFKKFDQTKKSLKSLGLSFKTLVLLSGVSSHPTVIERRAEAIQSNLTSINEIVKDFIEIGGKHIIFASSEWVYSRLQSGLFTADPRCNPSPYGRQKLYGEILIQELCEAAEIDFTNLRLGIIWGNRGSGSAVESITSSIISSRTAVEVSHIKTGRRFVHIKDVCLAIIGAIKNRSVGTFDVQGKEVITMDRIIRSVSAAIGIKDISVNELNTDPDIRYLSDNEIKDLPFEWRFGDFSTDIRILIEKVHNL